MYLNNVAFSKHILRLNIPMEEAILMHESQALYKYYY